MTHASDALSRAFEIASGRSPSSGQGAAEGPLSLARRVLEARAAGLAIEVCPADARARVLASFAKRARGLGTLARLIFDSALGRAVAMRGATQTRTLRFETMRLVLDVELSHGPGQRMLHLAVEGARWETWFVVVGVGRIARRVLRADPNGYAALHLPAELRSVVVRVLVYGLERLRTPEIDLT